MYAQSINSFKDKGCKKIALSGGSCCANLTDENCSIIRKEYVGQVQWFTPLDHLTSGVLDQPGQDGETLSLLKIQKLAGHGGRHL